MWLSKTLIGLTNADDIRDAGRKNTSSTGMLVDVLPCPHGSFAVTETGPVNCKHVLGRQECCCKFMRLWARCERRTAVSFVLGLKFLRSKFVIENLPLDIR